MAKHGSHSVSFGRCELFKRSIGQRRWGGGGGGGGGDENKNKFEKLKANRSQSKERKFVPKCRRKNLLGVFAMMKWASTSGNFKAISLSSLSFEGGIGGKGRRGCQIQSVINKRPNCGR